VLFVSDNAADMFGIAAGEILDKSYLLLTDSERERNFLKDRIGSGTILFPNPVRLTIKGREYDAVFHAHGGTHQIEIEPVRSGDATYDEMSLRATAELYDPPSIEELYQRAVRMVREVSGFDRVMLYRFDARQNGQVIAEASREGIGSFLGLYFPSSDISARARELYLQNFTRYIPDIGARSYPLSGIFPGGGHAESGHPVDMSLTNLRGVAPCHITYLQNIGIRASMSFSINVDGRLWGLFACHHYAPRQVSYEQRVVCEQTAMMFIYRLAQMSSTAARLAQRQQSLATLGRSLVVGATLRRRIAALEGEWGGGPDATAQAEAAQALLARMVTVLQAGSGFLLPGDPAEDALLGDEPVPADLQRQLLDLVEADSAAIIRHGRVWRIGDAPPAMAIYAIASMFGRELPDLRSGGLHVYATDCLSAAVPVAESINDRAAGILAAALSLETPAYVLWFRREQVIDATWAGNPSADAMSAGSDGMNPRASFAAWKQDIRNLSRSWVLEDVQIADELATLLRDLDSQIQTRVGAETAYRDRPPVHGRPVPAPVMASAPMLQAAMPLAITPAAALSPAAMAPRRVIRIGQR
jgi:light-regulated signal transduction histidine kinase (bacteriophytochrome)